MAEYLACFQSDSAQIPTDMLGVRVSPLGPSAQGKVLSYSKHWLSNTNKYVVYARAKDKQATNMTKQE